MSRKTLVSDAISSLETKLTTLCMREQEARNILEFISEQRRSLEREHAALRAQLNPFNWLPAELLIAIFVSFVHTKDAPECENTDKLAFYRRPITLSHVCQRWRTVALSTSSLWTSVVFTGTNSRAVAMYLERSKNHPLDIAGSISSTFSSEVECSINSHLDTSSSRWHSVMWPACPPQILQVILTILNSRSSFPYLEVLHLNQKESVIHIKDNATLTSITPSRVSFPLLKAIHLGHVSPSDIPPSSLPSVSELELNFTSNANRHLRMSDLCAMISRTPNLTELSIHGAVPLMDIYVRMSLAEGDATQGAMLPHFTRRTPSQISPLVLPYLHRLEWSFAPPRDLWFLFYFIKMPALRQLDLCLNQGLVRWDQYFNNQTNPHFVNPLLGEHQGFVRLASLEDFSVECVDADGLTSALKKIIVPILKQLSITYLPPGSKKPDLPQLPRHESMFREPRLPTLTGLTLSCFELDSENTTTMLKYMPSLTHLTFRSCLGTGKVVCALSGGTCKNSHSNLAKSWICPRLECLVLTNCIDVKFRCLSGMIRTRRIGSLDCFGFTLPDSISSAGVGGPLHGAVFGRPVKPLKKRSPPLSNVSTSSASSTSAFAPSSISASSNGSFVPGWNSHEILKPACIKSLYVEGCPRVSEVEALSLEEKEWDVSSVTWLC